MTLELTKGLVGHWTMDDRDTADGTVRDQSAYDNHGTIEGGVTTGETGVIGEACSLDGTDGRITFPRSHDGFPKSFSVWFQPQPGGSDYPTIIGDARGGDSNYCGIVFQYNNPDNRISIQIGDGEESGDPNRQSHGIGLTLTDGQWYHLAGVCRSINDVEIYVDGTEHATTTTGTGTSVGYRTEDGAIGYRDAGSMYLAGKVDDARIYNRPLSEEEIQFLANMQSDYASAIEPTIGAIETGTFQTPTTTGSVDVSVGFQPDYIELRAANTIETTDEEIADHAHSYGWSHGRATIDDDGTITQLSLGAASESSSTDTGTGVASDGHVLTLPYTDNDTHAGDITGWLTGVSGTGFSIAFDTVSPAYNYSSTVPVSYAAYRFADPVDVEIGATQTPTSAGTQSISTDLSPSYITLTSSTIVDELNFAHTDANSMGFSHGAVSGRDDGQQLTMAESVSTADVDGHAAVCSDQDALYLLYTSPSGSDIQGRTTASLSFTDDGFDLEYDEVYTGDANVGPSAQKLVLYSAFELSAHQQPALGTLQTPTSSETLEVDVGFYPSMLDVTGSTTIESLNTEADLAGETFGLSHGFAQSPSQQHVLHYAVDSDSTNAHAHAASTEDIVYLLYVDASGNITGRDLAAVSKVMASGFELDFSEAHTGEQAQYERVLVMYRAYPR